jgi:hypothetical protein
MFAAATIPDISAAARATASDDSSVRAEPIDSDRGLFAA